jgi:hypothetical protein
VLSLVDGLLNDELPVDGLLNDELLPDGLVDALATGTAATSGPAPGAAPAPESTAPFAGPAVSLGGAPMTVSRPGDSSDDSFTEEIEARQRM